MVVETGRDERAHRQHGRLRFAASSARNHFRQHGAGKPADPHPRRRRRARAVANFFGVRCPFAAPLAGPAVRIVDGLRRRRLERRPDRQRRPNLLERDVAHAAVRPCSSRAARPASSIAGNEGIAIGDFGSATRRCSPTCSRSRASATPLGRPERRHPAAGDRRRDRGRRSRAPATPGAVVRVLQQWRADDPNDGVDEPYPQGYTLPTTPGDGDRRGRRHLVAGLLRQPAEGPEADGLADDRQPAPRSSPRSSTATTAPDLPVAKITAGPTAPSAETSATFSFSTPTPGASLECGVDGGGLRALQPRR